MTATVTALIELAVEHGLGVAFLVVGGQVVLDRLRPVEHIVAHLFQSRKPADAPGAHRRVPESQRFQASRFAPRARHRNEPICCTK
jgi:hypothetical protein